MIIYKIGDSMKLNNKGFAFSTMLYGSMALIAAVLYIILNINKESADTTYYYGEELLHDLNDCVTEEIALENCYSSGSTTCDPTAFQACLGIRDSGSSENGVIISEELKGKTNLVTDQYVDVGSRYIYVGSDPDNYIEYSGKLWRIVSIEVDRGLLIIDINKYGDKAWDTDNKGQWSSSTLNNELNRSYITTISDTSKLSSGAWYKSLIYPSASTSYSILDLVSQEIAQSTLIDSERVGLLSLSDYIKASQATTCLNDVFGEETQNCNSWLVQYKGWVLDINGEEGSDDEGYAYYFGNGDVEVNNVSEFQYNKPFLDKTDEEHEVYPVVKIKWNSIYKGGSGTLNDPYVLK